jgi:hypothetical protein
MSALRPFGSSAFTSTLPASSPCNSPASPFWAARQNPSGGTEADTEGADADPGPGVGIDVFAGVGVCATACIGAGAGVGVVTDDTGVGNTGGRDETRVAWSGADRRLRARVGASVCDDGVGASVDADCTGADGVGAAASVGADGVGATVSVGSGDSDSLESPAIESDGCEDREVASDTGASGEVDAVAAASYEFGAATCATTGGGGGTGGVPRGAMRPGTTRNPTSATTATVAPIRISKNGLPAAFFSAGIARAAGAA